MWRLIRFATNTDLIQDCRFQSPKHGLVRYSVVLFPRRFSDESKLGGVAQTVPTDKQVKSDENPIRQACIGQTFAGHETGYVFATWHRTTVLSLSLPDTLAGDCEPDEEVLLG